jgi:hypothetical protein
MHRPATTDSTCRHACVQNVKINANSPPNKKNSLRNKHD